jgi:hypothetical protein
MDKMDKGSDMTQSSGKKSLDEMINEAKEEYSLEELEEKLPWLNIVSARWKKVLIINSDTFPPAPSDIVVTGILTLKDEYLDEIQAKYSWFDGNRSIPESLVTEEMKGYQLQTSQDYKDSYLPMLKGYNVSMFIDFEKKIVLFSY